MRKSLRMGDFNFNNFFRQKTQELALAIIRWYSKIERPSRTLSIMGDQLIRCSTSSAANFRAKCLARSKRERFAKICIVVEESDETVYWLETIMKSGLVDPAPLEPMLGEAEHVARTMTNQRYKWSLDPEYNSNGWK